MKQSAAVETVQRLIEPLTRRERQMLALLAEGYSRPEIAVKLTLALTSVKFHVQHLYGKLGVNSKRQALNRAQALGLLDRTAAPGNPAPRHNLPLQVTRFFGRDAEIAQLRDWLDEHRLVTLTGSGGVGKTRLALRVAEEALGEFADGVWLVELAALSDAALVLRQAAFSLGVGEEPGRSNLEALTGYLRQRQVLVVLDNAEHLAEACAHLAETLLRAGPAVKILVTSREPLRVEGEAVFRVPSLAFPAAGQPVTAARLAEFASARLLVDRARLVLPNYVVAAHNAPAIAHICQQLDGIPLALELAAARLKLLTAEQVAARLADTLHLLTTGRRGALPRHQTLQAALDWSYALLIEPEQLLLLRLSVFAGGWTLTAAEFVCAGDGLESRQILDLLTALVDKSLVIANRGQNTETRYRLLEMVRQFAQARLQPADRHVRLRRHHDYFVAFAENHYPNKLEPEYLHRMAFDLDNVRLALNWSFNDPASVLGGLRLLPQVLLLFYSLEERVDWCQRGLALAESQLGMPADLLATLLLLTRGCIATNDPQTALAMTLRALAIIRQLQPENAALMLESLGYLFELYLGLFDDVERGRAALAEAKAVFQRTAPDPGLPEHIGWQAQFLNYDGLLARHQGDYEAAKAFSAERLQLSVESGDRYGAMFAHFDLGTACLWLGEYAEARRQFWMALDHTDVLSGNTWQQALQANDFRWLGEVDLRQGRLGPALDYCRHSLRLSSQVQDRNVIATGLGLAADIAARQGQPERAARLSGASQTLYARQGRKPWEDSSLDTLLPGWRAGPDQAALAAAYAAGEALSVDAAVALALAA